MTPEENARQKIDAAEAKPKDHSVTSRDFIKEVKGRGVRVAPDTEIEQVNPGIKRKACYSAVGAVRNFNSLCIYAN